MCLQIQTVVVKGKFSFCATVSKDSTDFNKVCFGWQKKWNSSRMLSPIIEWARAVYWFLFVKVLLIFLKLQTTWLNRLKNPFRNSYFKQERWRMGPFSFTIVLKCTKKVLLGLNRNFGIQFFIQQHVIFIEFFKVVQHTVCKGGSISDVNKRLKL